MTASGLILLKKLSPRKKLYNLYILINKLYFYNLEKKYKRYYKSNYSI